MAQTDRIAGYTGDIALKLPCRVATTAAITLSGVQTVDGVLLEVGDRVLVKDQVSGVDNGIYVVQTGSWTRATDFDGARDAVKGTQVLVNEGTTYANWWFRVDAAGAIIVGATSISFAVVAAPGDVALGAHTAMPKTTPVDADEIPIADSAVSWFLKKITFANLWAWIQGKLASPGAIGGTTPAAGTFTSLQATGVLTTASSAPVASAAILDLTAATGNIVPVTGTTPVEAITMPVGNMTLIPVGALPLVYNATTCKIISGANYTCTAGAPVELVNDGSVVHVFPIGTAAPANIGVAAGNVQQVDQAITATTRAATTTLGTSLYHTLSDTSAIITAFNGVAGVRYRCRALGTGIIQYHATNLITQTGADITTEAGDTFDVYMLTDTTCRVENYVRASGAPLIPTASQAEMESGTEAALRSMSPLLVGQAIAAQASPAAYKMTTETRNMAAASGSVSYTGAGFAPKKVTIYADVVSGITFQSSQGEAVNTASGIAQTSLRGWWNGYTVGLKLGSGVVDMVSVGGLESNRAYFNVTSFDADGITGYWTKLGAPTGTLTMNIIYER